VQHGAAIRLAPSLHKCAVYGTPSTPAYPAAQQSARILDIQHATDGLVAAGTPIGTDDYITAHMEDCADQAIAFIRKLQDLPPPLTAQAKFLLLSRSLQRRLTHFTRVVRPPLALDPLAKLQTALKNAAFSILTLPADPNTAATMGLHHPLVRMQLRLPLREGGFGLNATGVVPDSSAAEHQRPLSLHTASFLAAAAHCHDALPEAPPTLHPFLQLHFVPTGPCAAFGPSLCASMWRSLSHSEPALHPSEPRVLPFHTH
jgi:hypothetical protein